MEVTSKIPRRKLRRAYKHVIWKLTKMERLHPGLRDDTKFQHARDTLDLIVFRLVGDIEK